MKAQIVLVVLLVVLVSPQVDAIRKVSVKNSVVCTTCRLLLLAVEDFWAKNATKDDFVDVVNFLCEKLHIQDERVCKGITSQFKEEFLYVLGQLVLNPRQFCGFLIKDCGKYVNPFSQDWTIPLPGDKPPVPKSKTKIPEGKPKLRMLQISDIHFDMTYSVGSEAHCDEPICCHQKSRRPNATSVKLPAGQWGTLGSCDVPYWTVENMLQHISTTQNVDYILIAGDYMSHSDWTYTKAGHIEIIKNLTRLLNQYFPDTPTFWTVGNHEGVPVNSFAPHTVPRKYWPSWLYETLNNAWKNWLPKKTEKDILYRASYSVLITGKLRLISINTGYCDETNFWIYLNKTDPDGTLAWLADELYSAERLGEKVQILGHIPPGQSDCMEGWAKNYYRIVNRFEKTIVGQFFGHVHTDSFTVFYENPDDYRTRATGVMYVAPSVTSFTNLHPAFRLYTIDGDYTHSTYEVIDHETWFFNLTEANKSGRPQWTLLYQAKEYYKLKGLQPEDWNKLIGILNHNPVKFTKFARNYNHGNELACDSKCRGTMLCALRSGHHNATALCPDIHMPIEDLPNHTRWHLHRRHRVHRLIREFRLMISKISL